MTSTFIQPLGMARNPEAAALLVNRTFNEGRPDQYKRELVWNAVQAGARNIYATAVRLEGDDAEGWGVKAAFVDDGVGMASSKITDYIGELFNGASAIGADGNFQMGARVSTLPFNRTGLLVASWTEDEPDGTLLHIAYDPETETYGVVPQERGNYLAATGVPPEYLRHPSIAAAGHGTVFVLLGNDLTDHTVGEVHRDPRGQFVYPDVRNADVDWHHYNAKFWALPEGVRLRVMWAPSALTGWASQIRPGRYFDQADDGAHKFTYRTYAGVADRIARYAESSGSVAVTSVRGYRANVHWALFPEAKFTRGTDAGGGDSSTRDYGIPLGLFGERTGDELYAVRGRGHTRVPMEHYGISRRELRDRLVLVVEPDPPSAAFIGATPSGARDRLLIANAGLPHDEWGAVFAEQMPEPIRARLRELNGENSKDAAERQKRLANRLREFFGRPLRRTDGGATPARDDERPHATRRSDGTPGAGTGKGGGASTKGQRRGFGAVPDNSGADRADQRHTHRPREVRPVWDELGDEFTENPAMIAHWNESRREVFVNGAHPVITEVVRSEQVARRADRAEEIAAIVRDAVMDYLVSLVLGVELYTTSAMTGGRAVGTDFVKDALNDHALTAACLNVGALEHGIRQRFQGRTGFRRVETADEAGAA